MKQPMQIDKNTMNDNLKINYKCGKYINLDDFVFVYFVLYNYYGLLPTT